VHFVQINRIYTSMEISRRDMNKNIKWQSGEDIEGRLRVMIVIETEEEEAQGH